MGAKAKEGTVKDRSFRQLPRCRMTAGEQDESVSRLAGGEMAKRREHHIKLLDRYAGARLVKVGDVVKVSANLIPSSFRGPGYVWDDLMCGMAGQTFPVLEVPKKGMVGLPSSDGSQNGVWYFPEQLV